jgi:hypothetical protein
MNTFRASLGRFGLPLLAVWLILWSLGALFGLSVPVVILGVLALLSGILLLIST